MCFATTARAADRLYWTDAGGTPTPKVAFANLDGSGSGPLNTSGAAAEDCCPFGLAIDSAGGKVYWGSDDNNGVSYANLDGSGGGGDLTTTGVTVTSAEGVAIDPMAGRIYWADSVANKISFANLDNTGGGGVLNTTGATISGPQGVVIDPTAGRIYWANGGTSAISFANLNGTGGGDLNTTGATLTTPFGVAINPAAGRIYWANYNGNKISFANLSGTGGGGDLNTSGATVNSPVGVAIDPAAGRIYWASYSGSKISVANLDGTGGADLDTTGLTLVAPNFPTLLKTPEGDGAPEITGASTPGSVIACSQGSWAPDLLSSLLYRAPRTITYQWSLNGADIAGATTSSLTAASAGAYRCAVSASNEAGSATQTSAPHTVADVVLVDTVAPMITHASISPTTWAVNAKGRSETAVSAGRAKKGTVITYTLSEPARVVFTIERALPGRRVGRKCTRPTRSTKGKKCTRYKRFGRFAQAAVAGRNRKPFSGRIASKKLKPGRYRASLMATDPAGNASNVRRLRFRVVGPAPR
jgi:hypothetical protein